jgi:hypothetical protein
MTTTTIQKIRLNSFTQGQLFKAVERASTKLASTLVKHQSLVQHAIRHVSDMSENHVPSKTDKIVTTVLIAPSRPSVGDEAI